MDASARHTPARRAFTLVELLVVILIIGILVGLITAAALRARVTAIETAISTEITQLDMALKAYKEKFGEYPPDFTDRRAVLRHLARAFPRYDLSNNGTNTTQEQKWNQFRTNVLTGSGNRLDVNYLDAASAMVFWLGGMPENSSGSPRMEGFSANPTNPFQLGGSRLPPFFEFDETRVRSEAAGSFELLRYYPDRVNLPYVYFRARNGSYEPWPSHNTADLVAPTGEISPAATVHQVWPRVGHGWPPGGGAGLQEDVANVYVRPYWREDDPSTPAVGQYYNESSFQIIVAGLDGLFGGTNTATYPAPHIPSGVNLRGVGHADNLTNFTRGRIEKEMQ